MSKGARNVRYAEFDLESGPVRVHLVIDLDGGSRCDVATGLLTLDDMLNEFADYAGFDLGVSVESSMVASDHVVLDAVGAALGKGVTVALEESDLVMATGSCAVPNGLSLAQCAVDLRARQGFDWQVDFSREWLGETSTQALKLFFESFVHRSGASLHLTLANPDNDLLGTQALFRAFGRAMMMATRRTDRHNNSK